MKTGTNGTLDILIKNARVFKGVGEKETSSWVGVKNHRIVLGESNSNEFDPPPPALKEIDAQGEILSPGFIDVHGHSDFSLFPFHPAESRIFQGVTTEITGNCGLGCFPLTPKNRDYFENHWEKFAPTKGESQGYRLALPWLDYSDYVSLLNSNPLSYNLAPLVGHGTLRWGWNGTKRELSPSRLKKMVKSLEKYLEMGVFGLSTGLIYTPGCYAQTEELETLLRVVTSGGGIHASHIRSESQQLIEAITEVVHLSRLTKVPLQISHLKTSGGPKNWPKLEKVFEIIEEAQREGLTLFSDRYPYIHSETYLRVMLPDDIFTKGLKKAVSQLEKPSFRKAMVDFLKEKYTENSYLNRLTLGFFPGSLGEKYFGKPLKTIAEARSQSLEETLLDLLIESDMEGEVFIQGMCEDNLIKILNKNYVMVGSDSHACSLGFPSHLLKTHPRGWGSFNKFLKMVIDGMVPITLESAIQRLTSLPAQVFGLSQRGVIQEGFVADLILWNPDKMTDLNSFQNPSIPGSGISHLWVNGIGVLENGLLTGHYPGKVLKKVA